MHKSIILLMNRFEGLNGHEVEGEYHKLIFTHEKHNTLRLREDNTNKPKKYKIIITI